MASVAKRPDGRWRARYRDESGKEQPVEWRALAPTVERRLVAATRVGQDQLPAVRELMQELGTFAGRL